MKKSTHVPWWAIAIIATLLFSMSSCTKAIPGEDQMPNVTVGFQIAGVPIVASIGGGSGYYYPLSAYNNFVYGGGYTTTRTICYVLSKPGDPETVLVYDQNNNLIGKTRCWQGTGATMNAVFNSIVNWFSTHNTKCAVPVDWDLVPFTRGGEWNGTIR